MIETIIVMVIVGGSLALAARSLRRAILCKTKCCGGKCPYADSCRESGEIPK